MNLTEEKEVNTQQPKLAILVGANIFTKMCAQEKKCCDYCNKEEYFERQYQTMSRSFKKSKVLWLLFPFSNLIVKRLMVNNDVAVFAIDPPFRGSYGKFSARQSV